MENKNISSENILPWVEKYRPRTLNEVIGHNNILKILNTYLKKRNLPHLLFYGPPGTGKTSVIIAYAKQLYKDSYPFMVMELNASDERGIEVVRSRIKQFVMSDNVFFKGDNKEDIFKLVILDETDAMTQDAQAILRNIVEKYTNNARFCLICNYIKKINPALQSRCTSFKFSPINKNNIKNRLNIICKKEKIKYDVEALDTIIEKSNGDLRKALNILQTVSMSYKKYINKKNVNSSLNNIDNESIKFIFESLVKDSFEESYNKITQIQKDYNVSIMDIIQELNKILIEMILKKKKVKKIILKTELIKRILNRIYLIEYNSQTTSSNNLKIMALIALFKLNKN